MPKAATKKPSVPKRGRKPMAAEKSAARLAEIADAAATCFSDGGFRRTQVADIARAIGVSAGSLYLYADSKEALLHLAFMHLTDEPLTDLQTPFPDPGIDETIRLIWRKVKETGLWPELAEALAAGTTPTRENLEHIGGALYDTLAKQRRFVWLIDGCSHDIPKLNLVFRLEVRGAYLSDLGKLMDRLPGVTLTTPQKYISLRAAIEIIAWVAMHRRRETGLPDELQSNEEDARDAAKRAFAASLLGMRN